MVVQCAICENAAACIQCREENGDVFCVECAQPHHGHGLRCLIVCSSCHSKPAEFECLTCNNDTICIDCQARKHQTWRQMKRQYTDKSKVHRSQHLVRRLTWPTRTEKTNLHESIYNVRGHLPDRCIPKNEINDPGTTEHLNRIKERITKMLRLAGNPGTIDEGAHASRLATEWMTKYQLTKYDIAMKGDLPGGDYQVSVLFKGDCLSKDAMTFAEDSLRWVSELAKRMPKVFPKFVGRYYCLRGTYQAFLGVEDASWSAAELFCELLEIVSNYTKTMVLARRFKTAVQIESYALGMVDGLDIKSFADIPDLLRSMSEDDKSKLVIISSAGERVVKDMESKHRFVTPRQKSYRTDWNAYNQGKKDGQSIQHGKKRLRIEH